MDLTKMHNPYDFSNPISDSNLLVGRQREMQEIRYYLDNATTAPRPINLALLGQRASGKTSILNIIELEAKERHFCTVRINLDEDDVRTQLGFFSKLFDCILSAACEEGAFGGKDEKTYDVYLDMVNAYEVPDDKTFCPFIFPIQIAKAGAAGNYSVPVSDHNIKADLDKIYAELQRPIILLFDEGNVLAQSRPLLQKLRNVFMNTRGFMLIMTGTPDLFPVMDDVFSPIVRQFKKIEVGEFSDDSDTRDCIWNPLEKVGIHPAEIFDFETYRDVLEIHNLSGGRPYEIQLICHMLFRRVQYRRADKMKLDVGILDEVRRELETWQDITNRPVLTTIRNLDKTRLMELSVLCSLNGSATFDQVWSVEYIFHGDERWQRANLERALNWFCDRGIVKIVEGRIVFAGDEFDRIYAKYFAREQDVTLDLARATLSLYWRRHLMDFVRNSLDNRLEPFTPFMPSGGESDILAVAAKLASPESQDDIFVDHGYMAEALYTKMMDRLGDEPVPLIFVNPQLPWLNATMLFLTTTRADLEAIELGLSQLGALRERVAEIGGALLVEQRELPIVSPEILADKVTRTANERVRLSLASYHADEIRDAYIDRHDTATALVHARLCSLYASKVEELYLNNIGYLYLSVGELDLAREYLSGAANQGYDPEDEDEVFTSALSSYNLGILEAKCGNYAQAVDEIERSIEKLKTVEGDAQAGCLWVPRIHNAEISFVEMFDPNLPQVATEAARILRLEQLREPKVHDTQPSAARPRHTRKKR